MGSGTSSGKVGAPLNPRVDFAYNEEKKTGKNTLIDTPVIMDLQHGTIRYRNIDNKVERYRREGPHEGPERVQKKGYFYHARLDDFSENAELKKEASFKFHYVFQGPNSAKKKNVYYVFGVGLEAVDPGILRQHQAPGHRIPLVIKPEKRRPNDAYFLLEFMLQNNEIDEDYEVAEELHGKDELSPKYEFKLTENDRVLHLKDLLSVKILKPVQQIHISYVGSEMRNEEVVGDLRLNDNQMWHNFLFGNSGQN